MALAGLIAVPRFSATIERNVVVLPVRSKRAVSSFVRPVFDPDTLRRLATGAIDAALHAGADWADIRIGDRRTYCAGIGNYDGELSITCGFGLRVRVQGAEAFIGGTDPVPETLAMAAQSAVATARELAGANPMHVESAPELAPLATVPVVTGEWHAPIQIDPFAISVDDHAAVKGGADGAYDGLLSRWKNQGIHIVGGDWPTWFGETRVFASSEGSLVTQHLGGVDVGTTLEYRDWRMQRGDNPLFRVGGQHHAQTGGFEVVLGPRWFTDLDTAMEEFSRYTTLPGGIMDVGRYPVIVDGTIHAQLLGRTLLPSLSLNRVLGNEVDVAGASFLTPPQVHLGDHVCSPLLSYTADGPGMHFGARHWDDEGVSTRAVPLIDRGTLVNYLTSRSTLPALHHTGMISTGTVSAPLGGITHADLASRPAERPPSVSVAPASSPMSLDALVQQLGTGLVVRGGNVDVDPSGSGGYIYGFLILEVRRGRVVRRVRDARLMFSTKRVLQTLVALGDASTLGTVLDRNVVPGVPWVFPYQALTAPAALYREIDMVPVFRGA
jgi:predicted Zn-dependent protease